MATSASLESATPRSSSTATVETYETADSSSAVATAASVLSSSGSIALASVSAARNAESSRENSRTPSPTALSRSELAVAGLGAFAARLPARFGAVGAGAPSAEPWREPGADDDIEISGLSSL